MIFHSSCIMPRVARVMSRSAWWIESWAFEHSWMIRSPPVQAGSGVSFGKTGMVVSPRGAIPARPYLAVNTLAPRPTVPVKMSGGTCTPSTPLSVPPISVSRGRRARRDQRSLAERL